MYIGPVMLFGQGLSGMKETVLNMDWNCWLRELALSASAVNVLPFAFRGDMPLLSCF